MAQSSERVIGSPATHAALPLRKVAAIGMVDVAILLLRVSAIFLLISPLLILLLAFA